MLEFFWQIYATCVCLETEPTCLNPIICISICTGCKLEQPYWSPIMFEVGISMGYVRRAILSIPGYETYWLFDEYPGQRNQFVSVMKVFKLHKLITVKLDCQLSKDFFQNGFILILNNERAFS